MNSVKKEVALIFGYNEYAFEIAKNISSKYKEIHIYKLNENTEIIEEEKNYKISIFDLSDEWDSLSHEVDMNKSMAIVTLHDMAKSIFLTISLRDTFTNLPIIAISNDKESADKLQLAGASRVIPITQTTANIIVERVEKPIVTEVLHAILYEKNDLEIAQVQVENEKLFNGAYAEDINWREHHNLEVLSVVHEDMSREFIYASKNKHHPLKDGDILVVVGTKKDIIIFEKEVGRKCNVDWGNWSR